MKKLDNFKATGMVTIRKEKADGTVQVTEVPNLVVNAGLNWIAGRMDDDNIPGQMRTMAIGDKSGNATYGNGGSDPAAGDLTLGRELARVTFTTQEASSNTVTYVATFGPGVGTGGIVEAGIFNSETTNSGTMLCRTTFPIVSKEAGDTITITWAVTVS